MIIAGFNYVNNYSLQLFFYSKVEVKNTETVTIPTVSFGAVFSSFLKKKQIEFSSSIHLIIQWVNLNY
jgi:hypothetical protein